MKKAQSSAALWECARNQRGAAIHRRISNVVYALFRDDQFCVEGAMIE